MIYNPEAHHRQSTRLACRDYSLAGAYFITICTQGRKCLFSISAEDAIEKSQAGHMLDRWFYMLEEHFSNLLCDAFVAMPNHTHFIVFIRDENPKPSLPEVVQWFKTMTTNEYIRSVKERNWPPFHKRLWQRNYYERIIRDEQGLKRAREYILNNPINWPLDRENPVLRSV